MVSLTDLQRFFRGTILLSEPLAAYTELGVGGAADYFLEVDSKEVLEDLLNYFRENKFPHLFLHSNLVVNDDGFRGAIILDKTQGSGPFVGKRCAPMFKSDTELHASDLIKQAGVSGLILGGAEVVGNVVVNNGNATARDIYNLVHHVQNIIHEQWDVLLPIELQFVGFDYISVAITA